MPKLTYSRIGFALALAASSVSFAAEAPATGPATAAVATGAVATAPSAPAPVVLDGYLAPVDAFEAKLDLKAYSGPFKVNSVVAHGASAKAGDVVLSLDTTEIEQAIIAAASALEVARAANAKQSADNTLAEQNDAEALRIATDAVADAQLASEWWTKTEAPRYLKQLELQLKNSENAVQDQEDELDQLRKMYKSEELTSATADIVVKRAVRQLEQSKVMLEITRGDVERRRATEYVDRGQQVERQLFAAKQGFEALKAQQELSKVERAAATLRAKTALKDAEKALNELEEDKAALTVKAGVDGVVLYGSFADGAWRGSRADAIKPDRKVDVSSPLLTVIPPGKLKAVVKIDETKVLGVEPGTRVKVKPTALESATLDGTIAPLAPLAGGDGSFPLTIDLGSVDPRLMPGMKVKVEMEAGK